MVEFWEAMSMLTAILMVVQMATFDRCISSVMIYFFKIADKHIHHESVMRHDPSEPRVRHESG